MQHLACIIPLVYRRTDIDTFVTLQTYQLSVENSGKHFSYFRLTNTGFAFQQKWLTSFESQEHRRGQTAIGNITLGKHRPLYIFYSLEVG